MKTKWILFLWIAFLFHSLPAQDRLRCKQITLEQGLSQSSVFSVCQDKKGFIWIGTESGLNRYDGYQFRIYVPDAKESHSLSNGYVWSQLIDSEGTLWVGTDKGLCRYVYENDHFITFLHDPQKNNSLSDNRVFTILEDRAGNIWVGTDGGLNRLDRQSGLFQRFQAQGGDPDGLSHNNVRSLLQDRAGYLWIGTEGGGLNRLHLESGMFDHFRHDRNDANSISNDTVLALYEDQAGDLWVGTRNGLDRFDPTRRSCRHYRHDPADGASLSDNWINCLYRDRSGILWIGTNEGGVNQYLPEKDGFARFRHNPNDPTSLAGDRVLTIIEDVSGNIWFGTYEACISIYNKNVGKFKLYQSELNNPNSLSNNLVRQIYEESKQVIWVATDGGGLNRIDRASGQYTVFKKNPADPDSISSNRVFSILKDRDGVMWVTTADGGLNRFDPRQGTFRHYMNDPDNPQSISHNFVRSIIEDKNGYLWLGTAEGGLNRFDKSTGLCKRYVPIPGNPNSLSYYRVYYLFYDRIAHIIWIGTYGGGLNRFDPASESFRVYRHDPARPDGICDDYIYCMNEDSDGFLWLGTSQGLTRFDRKGETFKNFTEKDGLPDKVIYAIVEDRQKNLWVTTNRGLARFNLRSGKIKNFDVNDGLQGYEFNTYSYCKSSDGELFFGGIRGFNSFYPEQLSDNDHVPAIVLTRFQLFNNDVAINKSIGGRVLLQRFIGATDGIALSYKQNVFSFEFSALDYQAPEKNQYAYYMEGLDEQWNYVGNRRYASYTGIPPGKYVFHVKGSNNDGFWNEKGVSLAIQISPPFWQTWWFRVALGLLGLLIVFAVFGMRVRRINARKEELEKLVQARTQELVVANEAADKARALAEAASLAKGMFLARMSHEIRTPMNSVIGFSDMLLDTELREEQVEFVRNITKSGEALLSLINEILDFSKIEAGQMTFQSIDFDLEVTAFDVCHLTQPRLGNKPVEVLCRVSDDFPSFIKSDPTRIRQVLLNLMSNATKFTHEGEIELKLWVEEESDTRLKLHATVRDTGIGIPADKLQAVFELFQQVDGSITRKYGGTGLGLAICKQIARLMQGEVWAESELGKGSTFHFTAWAEKSEKVIAKKIPVEVLAGKKALLVDDNDNNLNILNHVLHLVDMRTEPLRRGDEVLPTVQRAIAANDPFDICILDIQMPDMSGYDVARQVRAQTDKRVAGLIILAFTSSVSRRIKVFKDSGFDGFLPKPIQRHKLIAMLKRLLGEVPVEEAESKGKEVVLTQHTLAEEAKHSVRILLAEDNPMNQKLAQFMLTKAGYQLEIANNGREAVEKYTAHPDQYDLIFMDVHMPEVDGLEATAMLRHRGYQEIPIVALTADAMKEDRDKCLEAGMNDYMAKPIKREDVFAMVRKWVLEADKIT